MFYLVWKETRNLTEQRVRRDMGEVRDNDLDRVQFVSEVETKEDLCLTPYCVKAGEKVDVKRD